MTYNNVFNAEKKDYGHSKSLFLGQRSGLFDSIHNQHPRIHNLYKQLRSLEWDEQEFGFENLNAEFKAQPKDLARIMNWTIGWQWEGDSTAANTIWSIMCNFVSNSQLQAAWTKITENECLVDGTQVLTPTGWIDLADVNPTTLVAQYDPKTRTTQFVYPTNYIEKYYQGTVYGFGNQQGHMRQYVTPGHRMLIDHPSRDHYEVVEAKDCDFQRGAAKGVIKAPSTGPVTGGTQLTLEPLDRLLIAIQADGYVSDRYDGSRVGTIPVWFSFAKDRKIERLLELCALTGIDCAELTGSGAALDRRAQRRFKISVPAELSPHLKNYGWVDFTDKTAQWCVDFLDEQIEWDGFFTKNTGILHTTSREAVEVSQIAATLAGYRTHVGYAPDDRSDTYSGCWRLSWKDQPYVDGQRVFKSEHEYDGIVRCITVPSGFFLCRYEDAVSVTGNCLHTLTYSEIVRQSFDDPEQALSEILERKESFMRLEKVATVMSHCYEVSHKVALGIIDRDSDEAYDAAIMFTFALFVLERLQFMASFAVTFAIGQQDAFIPIAKAVQRICQDEYEIHVELDKAVMENEFNLDKGRAALQRQLPTMLDFLHETLVAELLWSDTIIPEDCTTLRYLRNADLRKWVKFNAKAIYDEIAQYIDFEMPEIMADAPEENPLIWIEDWINVAGIQASPQEQQNAQYRTNVIQRDDHGKTFGFKLFPEDEKIAA